MLIPSLHNRFPIFDNQNANPIQFMRRKSIVTCESDGIKPELAGHAFATHMHMLRLRAVKAVEEKPIRANETFYPWHSTALSLMFPSFSN